MTINYAIENNLGIDEFKSVLINSTLGERRPVDNTNKLKLMLDHGNLILTARYNGVLIGVSRSLSDFSFCTYLSDLAVDLKFQKQGIGKELIRRTKLAAPQAKLHLLAAPNARSYYSKIGMQQNIYCFYINEPNEITGG